MNPFATSYQEDSMDREASSRCPPKKVLNILESFNPISDDVTTTLFLGDLAVLCDEVKLYDLFIRFGAIESVQLKKSERDPQRAHLGFGFIKFANRASAERALQEMNGYFFLGRALRVGWALDSGKQQSSTSMELSHDPKKNQTAQIHVMFVTRELNRRVSELDIGAVFRRYGNLVDIAIKKNCVSLEYGVQSGYAFIHFAVTADGVKSAITAVEQANNIILDNITYRCKITHTLQAQLLSMNYNEGKQFVKRNLPPSLSHDFQTQLNDSKFKSYEPPPVRPVSGNHPFYSIACHNYISSSEYHDNDFQSYGMNPSMTMIRPVQSHEVLPPIVSPRLHNFQPHEHASAFFRSYNTISNDRIANTTDPIYSNCPANNGGSIINTTISQPNLNDSYHLPTRSLTSFISSTYEGSLQRRIRNSNDDSNNMMMISNAYNT